MPTDRDEIVDANPAARCGGYPATADVPERIWVKQESDWHDGETGEYFTGGTWDAGYLKEGQQYVRADIAGAMIAAALDNLADKFPTWGAVSAGIRAEADLDAIAALENVKQQVRNDVLRSVAAYIQNWQINAPQLEDRQDYQVGYYHGHEAAFSRILTMLVDHRDEGVQHD